MKKRVGRLLLALTLMTLTLALLAGGLDRWMIVYCAGWSLYVLFAMLSLDEDLMNERMHPPNPGADEVPLRAVRLLAAAHLVIGALDSGRWHIAPVPGAIRTTALVVMLGSSVLILRSMQANRFFSSVVRIQSDRGHRVVDGGPYGTIRHPGYLGMLVAIPCSGLALGSWVSFALALVLAALILRRVMFEDDFLSVNLPGYRDYAARVRYRLIPGAW